MEKLFSVKDNKAHSFGKIIQLPHQADATRMLHRLTNDDNVQISMFPEDYDLFELGEYDSQTGEIITHEQPKFIVGAVSFKKIQEETK